MVNMLANKYILLLKYPIASLLLSSVEGQPTVRSHFIPGLPTAEKTSYFLCHMTDKVMTFRLKHTVWISQPKHQAESCSS